MLNVILKVLMIIFLTIILMAILYFVIGQFEFKRSLNFLMDRMAQQAAADLAVNMPRSRDVNRVLIVPDVGVTDEGFRLTEAIAGGVESAQKFDVVTWEEAKATGGDEFKAQFGAPPGDLDTARAAAIWLNRNRKMDLQAIFRVVLERFTDGDSGGDPGLYLRAELVQTASGELIAQPYVYRNEPSFIAVAAHQVRKVNWFARIFLWLIIAGSLPFIAWGSGLAAAVLRKRNNKYNLVLLISMTLIAFFAAWILLGIVGLKAFSIIMLLVMTGVAAFWNFDALEFFSKIA